MKKYIPILRLSKFYYENSDDLRSKLSGLKKTMAENASRVNNTTFTIATAQNIVNIQRLLDEEEHRERCKKLENGLKFKVRNHAITALEGAEDPKEALRKILKELG